MEDGAGVAPGWSPGPLFPGQVGGLLVLPDASPPQGLPLLVAAGLSLRRGWVLPCTAIPAP